jgi:hypothetical protein
VTIADSIYKIGSAETPTPLRKAPVHEFCHAVAKGFTISNLALPLQWFWRGVGGLAAVRRQGAIQVGGSQ